MGGGGGRLSALTQFTSAKPEVHYTDGVQAPVKGPGSSGVLDALSCYMSLI